MFALYGPVYQIEDFWCRSVDFGRTIGDLGREDWGIYHVHFRLRFRGSWDLEACLLSSYGGLGAAGRWRLQGRGSKRLYAFIKRYSGSLGEGGPRSPSHGKAGLWHTAALQDPKP